MIPNGNVCGKFLTSIAVEIFGNVRKFEGKILLRMDGVGVTVVLFSFLYLRKNHLSPLQCTVVSPAFLYMYSVIAGVYNFLEPFCTDERQTGKERCVFCFMQISLELCAFSNLSLPRRC